MQVIAGKTITKVKLPGPSEKNIQNAIIDLLRYEGYMVWRNNVGAADYDRKDGKKSKVFFGRAGMSDIFAIQPRTGRFVSIEVKKPTTIKTLKRWQQDWITLVNMHGGIAFVATSLDDVVQQLGLRTLL